MDSKIETLLEQLENKYKLSDQDVTAYLEGLLYSGFVPYWDYVNLDTLLTLQKPKTTIKDEMIFIMYHQVTELYFKMILHEMDQMAAVDAEKSFMIERLGRINRYFTILTDSFNVMTDGMDREQFLKFRMALLPASGFQSAQYRKIEICSTDLFNLVDKNHQSQFNEHGSLEDMYKFTYWRAGATDIDTGNKTLTLRQFEDKYDSELLQLCKDSVNVNLWKKYKSLNDADQNDSQLVLQLRNLDSNVNVNWPLAHYKTAAKYLARANEDVAATGGTNWQQYLPPRMQKRVFYPKLWSAEEIENWGKAWVIEAIKPYQS